MKIRHFGDMRPRKLHRSRKMGRLFPQESRSILRASSQKSGRGHFFNTLRNRPCGFIPSPSFFPARRVPTIFFQILGYTVTQRGRTSLLIGKGNGTMATKEKLKTKAARVREEARETGKVILRAPRPGAGGRVRHPLPAGGHALRARFSADTPPSGWGWWRPPARGWTRFCALLGACFGYLLPSGLRRGAAGMWPAASWPSPWPLPSST